MNNIFTVHREFWYRILGYSISFQKLNIGLLSFFSFTLFFLFNDFDNYFAKFLGVAFLFNLAVVFLKYDDAGTKYRSLRFRTLAIYVFSYYLIIVFLPLLIFILRK